MSQYDLNSLVKAGEGRLSTVYKLDGGKMLKVFKQPGIARHEFERTLAVWQAGVSKQRPYEIVEVDGNESIVYDFLEGDLLLHRIERDIAHIFWYIALMAKCQAEIGKGACDTLPSGKDELAWRISHAPHLDESQRATLLKGLAAMPDGNRVLHGDLHPLNIIVGGNEVNAIDWMTCTRGDAAADIARSYFVLRYTVLRDDRHIFDTIGRSILFGMLGGYYLRKVLKESGADRRDVLRWLPFVAAVRLTEDRPQTEVKEIQRIVRRYCRGTPPVTCGRRPPLRGG